MEDKLKLAEIKGYLESTLNQFKKVPITEPYKTFYKEFAHLLDVIMDKKTEQKEPHVVTFPTDGSATRHIDYINKLIQENKSLKLDNGLLIQEKAILERRIK